MTKKIKDQIWVGVLLLYIGIGLLFLLVTMDYTAEEKSYYKAHNDYINCKDKFDREKEKWLQKNFFKYLEEEYCITSFEEWCKQCDSIMIKK